MAGHGPLVLRAHRPLRTAVLGAVAVALLALAGWLLFEQGRWRSLQERRDAATARRESRTLDRAALEENHALKQRIAVLERSAQVDAEASAASRAHIIELQGQLASLREELSFYRSVMASREAAQGLKIHRLLLEGSDVDGVYTYTLVLTRFANDDSLAKVSAQIQVEGEQDGEPRTLDAAALDVAGGELQFAFRHFHKGSGRLRIPSGFEPQRLRLTVTRAGQSEAEQRLYEWQSLVQPEGGE